MTVGTIKFKINVVMRVFKNKYFTYITRQESDEIKQKE